MNEIIQFAKGINPNKDTKNPVSIVLPPNNLLRGKTSWSAERNRNPCVTQLTSCVFLGPSIDGMRFRAFTFDGSKDTRTFTHRNPNDQTTHDIITYLGKWSTGRYSFLFNLLSCVGWVIRKNFSVKVDRFGRNVVDCFRFGDSRCLEDLGGANNGRSWWMMYGGFCKSFVPNNKNKVHGLLYLLTSTLFMTIGKNIFL